MHFFPLLFTLFALGLPALAAPVPFHKRASSSSSSSSSTTSATTASTTSITSSAPTASATSDSAQLAAVAQLGAQLLPALMSYAVRAEAVANIDSSCGNNTQNILMGLAAAQLVANEAQNVQEDDPVFQMFFQPSDVSAVQKMFQAISSLGGAQPTSKQYQITCPAVNSPVKFANTSLAITNGSQILLNPVWLNMISPNITQGISNNTTASDNVSANFIFLAYALLQELTHLDSYGSAAGLPKGACGASSGTCDTSSMVDQQNLDNLNNRVEAALCLKNSWDTFNAGGGQSPSIPTAKNAASYPAFATVYFLVKTGEKIPQASSMIAILLMALEMMKSNC